MEIIKVKTQHQMLAGSPGIGGEYGGGTPEAHFTDEDW